MGNMWMIVPGNPALSVLILVLIGIPFLYAGRRPMHGVILSLTRAISSPLRMGSHWLLSTANELKARNKAVLLAHGREEVTQTIDREFERVSGLVQRDLRGYPALQRKLMDEITRVEEDYQKSGEVPPLSPEWTKAVEAIASIKPSGDGLVEQLLQDISKSINKIYDRSLAEYRKAYSERHKILKSFMPFWRSLNQTLTRVDKNVKGLDETAGKIDVQMDKYKAILAESEKAEHALTASAGIQFSIATLVLMIAFGGAFVNFKLVSLPMSEMVGGGDYITATLQASEIAAMVIILIEVTMGIFILEALRITHLFPRINNMNDKMRHLLFWSAMSILFVLAGVEVALAYMRDQIAAANISLKQQLGGLDSSAAAAAAVKTTWMHSIPAAGQMVLGFILPFALAVVGLPLEYFIYSARTVFGVLLVLAIRSMAFVMRALGSVVKHIGKMTVNLYDVMIFIPLLIERAVTGGKGRGRGESGGSGVTSIKHRATGGM